MNHTPAETTSCKAAEPAVRAHPPAQTRSLKRSFIEHWVILIAGLLVVAAFLAFDLHEKRDATESAARTRLSFAALNLASNTESQLESINSALIDIQQNLSRFRADEGGASHISAHLETLANAMGGVQLFTILDSAGVVSEASDSAPVGMDFSKHPEFQDILKRKDPRKLFITARSGNGTGASSITLSRAIVDVRGGFSGVVSAAVNPGYFKDILELPRHSPDISSALVHESGQILFYASSSGIAPGSDLSGPDTALSRHLQSELPISLISGFNPAPGDDRLAALATLKDSALALDKALVVVISQPLSGLLSSWHATVRTTMTFFILLAALSSFALFVYQRRKIRDDMQAYHHRVEREFDAERLKLAARASGTGIWEFDVHSMKMTWDETMLALYGKDRSSFSGTSDEWKACLTPEDLPATEAAIKDAINEGKDFEAVFRIRHPDGHNRTIQAQAKGFADESGRTVRLIGICRDITQLKQLEEDALENRAHIVSILDSLGQNIAVLDATGTIIMVNKSWRDFSLNNGGSEHYQEASGVNYLDICATAAERDGCEEARAALTGIRSVLHGTCSEFRLEYPCHSPEQQRWFVLHVTPLRGAVWGAVISHDDITSRRLVEQSIRESQERFSAFFEHAMVGMATTSLDKGWLMVNPALCAILGYSKEELIRKTWAELTHPDDLAADLGHFQRLLNGEQDYYSMEKRFIRQDGGLVHAFIAASAVRRADRSIAFFAATVEDITQRKNAEMDLRRSQQLMQQFIDHLPGTAFVKDSELRVLMANRAFQTMLGMRPEEIIGKTNSELFPSHFSNKLDADDLRVFGSGRSTVIEESYEGRHFETSKFVIEGEHGRPLLGGITLEVTERQKFIERQKGQLEISELGGLLPEKEFLSRGLEIIERLTRSQIGFLHFVNDDQQTIELVTWTAGALKGCNAIHDQHYPISSAGIWADCARNKAIGLFNDYPAYKAKRGLPDGHAKLTRLISVPVIEEGKVRMILGVGNKLAEYDDYDCATVQLIGNDLWRIVRRVRAEAGLKQKITELIALNNQLEETNNKLLQSEKLAAIGQLAAGVAHEINNPVGYVSSNLNSLAGYVDDLLAINAAYADVEKHLQAAPPNAFERVRQIKADTDYAFLVSDVHHLLEESGQGLDRVRQIVQDLKNFSHVDDTGWKRVNLHHGLESTLNIVWNEIKYKAEVERDYGNMPEIYCIPSQINQIFLNLLTNAAQAIEEHGRIVLRSGHDEMNVWIEVRDTGSGIAPENLRHVFEPFFTTKPVGKGTGLGLSLSWSIIQRHHGKIEVESEQGVGTAFRITLPIEQPQATDSSIEATA